MCTSRNKKLRNYRRAAWLPPVRCVPRLLVFIVFVLLKPFLSGDHERRVITYTSYMLLT